MIRRALIAAVFLALLVTARSPVVSADTYPRQSGIDAIHYVFRLTMTDANDEIAGDSSVTVKVLQTGVTEFVLDLKKSDAANGGKGMTVSAVTCGGQPVRYAHDADRLRISLAQPAAAGSEISCTSTYRGVPAGGLRILNNIYGDRTAFSENWPNNARHWLPMIDHPYDKATGEIIMTAPAHYQVVANGLLLEETDLAGGMRRMHWKQSVPIASWLYAVGVARFTVRHYAVATGIAQQTWVFPQNADNGRRIFEQTGRRAFEYFSEHIGPNAYEKLAHVQAAGLGGGTEHATAIFYGEKGVAAGNAPVVHEVAHQWWGNAVTERDWDDVWLSEGFATYFTLLYTKQYEGRDAFVRGLRSSRDRVLQLEKKMPDTPIIHRNLADMSRVLNQFVYQKGGWTLHMLRYVIGTDRFWDGIREYYRRYQNHNASTDDLRAVMEAASGQDLRWFFSQWLTRSGVPALRATWRYDAAAKQITIELTQTQVGDPYRLPLEIGIAGAPGTAPRVEKVDLLDRSGRFTIAADLEPSALVLDPNTWLLMEAPVVGRE
ncbi:MAG TPA: M1 family aminopeptidase [Vicinamibacterales bacterium]|nr:M1 family aminopeptidase [Vicinamibacterales bacterium]